MRRGGAPCDDLDYTGRPIFSSTSLVEAALSGNLPIVRLLFKHGARPRPPLPGGGQPWWTQGHTALDPDVATLLGMPSRQPLPLQHAGRPVVSTSGTYTPPTPPGVGRILSLIFRRASLPLSSTSSVCIVFALGTPNSLPSQRTFCRDTLSTSTSLTTPPSLLRSSIALHPAPPGTPLGKASGLDCSHPRSFAECVALAALPVWEGSSSSLLRPSARSSAPGVQPPPFGGSVGRVCSGLPLEKKGCLLYDPCHC